MDVGQNARERALPWRNFVGHAAFLKGSAAMLGQFGRLIQSDREKRSATALAGPDTGGEDADGREVEVFVEPDRGAVLGGDGQRQFAAPYCTQGLRRKFAEHDAKFLTLIDRP